MKPRRCNILAVAVLSLFSVSAVQAAEVAAGMTLQPVNINTTDASLSQVLQSFAVQTGRNIVEGPDVMSVSNGVTLHLNNVQWEEALEVILKPYGFGYQIVGETIVISRLDKMAQLIAVEPLETRVFNLRFLDASDVHGMLTNQLSARGTMSIMTSRGQKGWEFATRSGGMSGYNGSSGALGKLERISKKDDDQVKSKTLIVTDVPGSLNRIAVMLKEIDVMPKQVLVESRFMEVNDNLLRDLGLDFNYVKSDYSIGQLFSGVTPAGVFNPAQASFWGSTLNPSGTDLSGVVPNTAAFAAKTAGSLQGAIRALQEDIDTKVLSAPRILTLNNQEATIIVGQKFPIIQSNVSGGSSANNTSTTLDYYENIGIQLNVVPQICDDGHINMIVHPSVSTINGFQSGAVSTGSSSNQIALTRYPVIDTREAETQILLKNKETVVIGGLLKDQKNSGQHKIPFLGDIPLLGRLFRRDIDDNRKINLLIFLSATIVDENNYDTIIAKEGEATMEGVKPVVAPEVQPAVKEEDATVMDEE